MPRSCASLSTAVMSLGLHHRAGRIVGRIQNDDFGARRDGALHHVRSQREIVPLVGGDVDRLAAGIANDVLKRDPVGHRQNDFVAVVDQHLNGIEQRVLAAGRGDAIFALVVGAEIRGVPLQMASRNSAVPPTAVYLVKLFRMAAIAASLMCSGRVVMRLTGAQIDQVQRPWRGAFRLRRQPPWWRKPRCVECDW